VTATMVGPGLGLCPGCGRRMVAEGNATREVALYAERGLCTRCVNTSSAELELFALAQLFYRPDAQHWLPRAACRRRGVDPAWFYPHPWESHAEARSVCRRCPVTRECLKDALDTKDAFGIRGGFTPEERAVIYRHQQGGAR